MMTSSRLRARRCAYSCILLLVGVSVVIAGCAPAYEQHRVKTLEEAGSTHIAILSVARWERYRDALQPNFTLSPADALVQSIPNTEALEDKLLQAFSVGLQVGTPGATTLPSLPANPEGTRTAAALGPANSVLSTSLGRDPLMKYYAALALWQEVQIINHYVKDAAVANQFVPYLVRLQVTLLPRARNEPYDAYATIGLFRGGFPDHESFPDDTRPFLARTFGKPPTVTVADPHPPATQPAAAYKGATSLEDIRVVPLLVTDDIESAIHSRSLEELQRLALALTVVEKGVGGTLDLGALNNSLQTAVGSDYNSLFTVARVSENTVRVRFGAMQQVSGTYTNQRQATAGYATVAQTHSVTLLVLVPRDLVQDGYVTEPRTDAYFTADRMVRVVSKTTMVDATSGQVLPNTETVAYRKGVEEALARRGIANVSDEDNELIARCIAADDYAEFYRLIRSQRGWRVHFPDALWLDLVSLRDVSPYQTDVFDLPPLRRPRLVLDEKQNPVIADDPKAGMTVTVRGLTDIDASEMSALLTGNVLPNLADKNDATAAQPAPNQAGQEKGAAAQPAPANGPIAIKLTPTSVTADDLGTQLSFTFPSLKAANLKVGTTALTLQVYKLHDPYPVLKPPSSSPATIEPIPLEKASLFPLEGSAALTCLYAAKSDQQPAWKMSIPSKVINAVGGAGRVLVYFDSVPPDQKLTLGVDGADSTVSAAPGILKNDPSSTDVTVQGSGVVEVNLINLNPIAPVTFTATQKGYPPASVTLPVVQLAATAPPPIIIPAGGPAAPTPAAPTTGPAPGAGGGGPTK